MKPILEKIRDEILVKVETGVRLTELTTYRIGGPAEMLATAETPADILAVVRACAKCGAPLTVIGAGSNVLAPDEGVAGMVLRIYGGDYPAEKSGDVISVNAACPDEEFTKQLAAFGVAGFEWLCDIPGTVGGAIVQNAATDDGAVSDTLIDATFIDRSGAMVTKQKERLGFGYRESIFKSEWGVIVSARFKIERHDNCEKIINRMNEIREARHKKFPMERPNCGSVFKRPPGDYAGRLIQEAGLGGLSVGGAMVSEKHRNFIVLI